VWLPLEVLQVPGSRFSSESSQMAGLETANGSVRPQGGGGGAPLNLRSPDR